MAMKIQSIWILSIIGIVLIAGAINNSEQPTCNPGKMTCDSSANNTYKVCQNNSQWSETFNCGGGNICSNDVCVNATSMCVYTYSSWTPCSSISKQSRMAILELPVGCKGTPLLVRTCKYVPQSICTPVWTTGEWSACLPSNLEVRTATDSNNCSTTSSEPSTSQPCVYNPN